MNKGSGNISFNQYQRAAKTTAIYPLNESLYYLIAKLNGEAGEVAEKYAKWRRDNIGSIPADGIIKELGDCLWYIAMIAEELEYDLAVVAHLNLEKLQDRKERGVLGGSGDNR